MGEGIQPPAGSNDETIVGKPLPPELQRIGIFTVLGKIGQGGMGAIYKAHDPSLDRTVAIKVLPGHLAGDADFNLRFKREAMAAAKLSHANIVQVYATGEDSGTHYIAMEFIDGESLQKRLTRQGRLDLDEALAVTIYVAEALSYAWNKAKIIHRDIKPDNILLSADGEVKLTDLGLAKSLREASVSVTSTGTIMGSAQYISPEQARGEKEIDFRTDIYSLGCTLYHMLTGRVPFEGAETMGLLYKHVHEAPPDPRTLRPDCPPRVASIVLKMMAKDRNHRPARYDDLICELTALHAEATGIVAAPTPAPTVKPATTTEAPTMASVPTPTPKPQKRSLPYTIAAGVVAVAAIAGLLIWSPWKPRGTTVPGKPEQEAWKDAINLLPLIDAQKDAVRGKWKLQDGGLVSDDASYAGIEIPYRPPAEYDFHIIFTRLHGNDAINQFLHKDGHAFAWQMGGSTNTVFAFSTVRGAVANNNPTTIKKISCLETGRRYVSLVQVRNDGVKAYLDGNLITQWKTDYQDMTPASLTKLRDMTLLGVGSHQSPTIFHRIEVREVTGKGVFIRGAPSSSGNDPFVREVAALPAEEQVKRVVTELKKLNPNYNGQEEHRVENGQVVMLKFYGTAISNISPVQAMRNLSEFNCSYTQVADLSPLRGLALTRLGGYFSDIADLSPLKGMPLRHLNIGVTKVGDLSPVLGMPLEELFIRKTPIADLTPLAGAPLRRLDCDIPVAAEAKNREVLNGIKALEWLDAKEPSKFWMSYDEAVSAGRTANAESGWQNAVNLLALLDPEKDTVDGTWTLPGGELVSGRTSAARIEIPYRPPDEYDFRIVFTRREGDSQVFQMLSKSGRAFAWMMGLKLGPVCGFDWINGIQVLENPTGVWLPVENGRRYTSLVQVRRDGLRAFVDGRLVALHKTDYKDTLIHDGITLRDPTLLGVGSWSSTTIFHRIEVREVTGKGIFTRGAPPATALTSTADAFVKEVATLPAEEQVKRVVAELKRLNPGYDGKEEHKIENGMVTFLQIDASGVKDIMPLRALTGLAELRCSGPGSTKPRSPLSDLTPLRGLPLTKLVFNYTEVSDLSPLQGMPFLHLEFNVTPVSDLSPLRGMPLQTLLCYATKVKDLSPMAGAPLRTVVCWATDVSDLSPLVGSPLNKLSCGSTKVTDFKPLQRLPLTGLDCDFVPQRDANVLRSIKTLQKINAISNIEFWKQVDAGKVPGATVGGAGAAIPSAVHTNAVGAEMVYIPPGEFLLGSTKQEREWAVANRAQEVEVNREGESPRQAKINKGFFLGRTEVTVGQWKKFVAATGYVTDGERKGESFVPLGEASGSGSGYLKGKSWRDPNFSSTPKDNDPVCCISWNDAEAFCRWLTECEQKAGRLPSGQIMRLPTEAEWEYACRAGSQTKFWWGDSWSGLLLNGGGDGDGFKYVAPVDARGARGRNAFGLADMLGNVSEWCVDDFDMSQAHGEFYKGNPKWRVVRGANFWSSMGGTRCATRDPSNPDASKCQVGFRVCLGSAVSDVSETAAEQVFIKEVAALPHAEQVKRVAAKLKELNPEFDGKIIPSLIDDPGWAGITFSANGVRDISPVSALSWLKEFTCSGDSSNRSAFSDLSPLKGLRLRKVDCGWTRVSDLSPLKGTQLRSVNLTACPVTDFSPLNDCPVETLHLGAVGLRDLLQFRGWQLKNLNVNQNQVSDLTPLRGMPLTVLNLGRTKVRDLSPLGNVPLTWLNCSFTDVTDLSPLRDMPLQTLECDAAIAVQPANAKILRSITTLEKINSKPAAEFWKQVDAGNVPK